MKFRYHPLVTLQLLATTAIWGSLYVGSGILLKSMPAMLLLFFRFGISSVLLLFAAWKLHMKMIEKQDWPKVFLIGFIGYFLSNAGITLSIQYAGSSFASLFNALNPICITLAAAFVLKEKITRLDILSLLAAVAGAAIIIGFPGDEVTPIGVFFAVIGLVTWSYTAIQVRSLGRKYNAIVVTGSAMGVAGILFIPASIAFIKFFQAPVHLTWSILPALLYVVLICSTFSHFLWNNALSKCDASYCASFYPVQPIVSVLLGIILFHEKITLPFLIGALLIVCAMLLHSQSGK